MNRSTGRGMALLSAGLAAGVGLAVAAVAQTTRPEHAARRVDAAPGETAGAPLRPVSAFVDYPDAQSRSVALFREAGRVITHPRCMNCHPATRSPTQGDDVHAHLPHVVSGVDDKGAPGMRCVTCHQTHNTEVWGAAIRSVPGHAPWFLAPRQMAWQGRSLGQICEQIKDPKRNGGRTLAQIHHHMAEDGLVGWGWRPGPGREQAPGTQEAFGKIIAAWIQSGAACPAS